MIEKKTGSKNVMLQIEAYEFLKNELHLVDRFNRRISISKKVMFLKRLWNKYGVLTDITAFFQEGKDYLEVMLNPTMGNVIFKISLFAQRAINVKDVERRNKLIEQLSDDVDKWTREIGLLRHEEEGRDDVRALYHRKRPEREEVDELDIVGTSGDGAGAV